MIRSIFTRHNRLGNLTFKRWNSTIYALSTNPGRSAIAIVRVSGENCRSVYKSLTKRELPEPRRATTAKLHSPNNEILDHALTLYFKGPKSYTGEDLLEFHLHGGQAVIRSVLDAIKHNKNTRYAEAGEFTKRAFRNDRLDLTQIEGIRDIIDAETELQRQAAVASAGGATKVLYDQWRTEIVRNMGMLTALIDFSDDNADVTGTLFADVKKDIDTLLDGIRNHLLHAQRSELLFSGLKMNLLGPPNAGKSSLLNTIAKREAAIVSSIPGTTRDILEVGMDIGGYKILIGDTAGLRTLESLNEHEQIEHEGIKRAKERFRLGDLVVCVLPADEPLAADVLDEIRQLRQQQKGIIVALNKCDTQEKIDIDDYAGLLGVEKDMIIPVSCKTQQNVPILIDKVKNICGELTLTSHGPPIGASQRIQDLLQQDVIQSLETFLECDDVVIATSELQFAIDGIGKITGKGVGVEEILGVVFSSFCIGK